MQKNPSTIRIPEEDIGSDSHLMDRVVLLDATAVLDKNITELCKDAGKVLFKGASPKLLLSGMWYMQIWRLMERDLVSAIDLFLKTSLNVSIHTIKLR